MIKTITNEKGTIKMIHFAGVSIGVHNYSYFQCVSFGGTFACSVGFLTVIKYKTK